MEIQQEIVEDLEKLIASRKGISETAKNICEFCREPKTKTEVLEFTRLYLIEKLFNIPELPRLGVKLLPQRSTYNSKMLYDAIMYRYENDFIPGKAFGVAHKAVTEKILKFMRQLGEEIATLPYDDLVDRNIALRRSYVRLLVIFRLPLAAAIEPDQFPTMTMGDFDHVEYMTMSIDELEQKVKDSFYSLEYSGDLDGWIYQTETEVGSEVRLKTFLNFAIYLGSLVRY